MRRTERGFTLVETAIAVAIVALLATAGVAMAMASRPAALAAATERFDALLDAARTQARVAGGVTLAFAPLAGDPPGQGFRAQLYGGRPAFGAVVPLHVPALEAHVAIGEREALAAAPFALVIHADGRVAGLAGYDGPGASAASETPCPGSGAFHFVFSAAGGHADRFVPCRLALATTGVVTPLAPPGAATPAPLVSASACLDAACAGASAPPNASGQCPPNYFFLTPTECVDPPLQATPSSLLFLRPSDGAQTVRVHEDDYSGPIFLGSSQCGDAVTISGGGSGPDTAFTVAPAAAGSCTFAIGDDHGGSGSVSVTTYGPLTVSPARLTFSDPSAPAARVSLAETAYTGAIVIEGQSPSPSGERGCAGFARWDPSTATMPGGASLAVTVAPLAGAIGGCVLTAHDDHGGIARAEIVVNAPATVVEVCVDDPRAGTIDRSSLPWTQYVGVSTSPPCRLRLTSGAQATVGWTYQSKFCDVGAPGGCQNGTIRGYWEPIALFPSVTVSVPPTTLATAIFVRFANVVDGGAGGIAVRMSLAPFQFANPNSTQWIAPTGPELPLTWDGTRYVYYGPGAVAGTYYFALSGATMPSTGGGSATSFPDRLVTFDYEIDQFE